MISPVRSLDRENSPG